MDFFTLENDEKLSEVPRSCSRHLAFWDFRLAGQLGTSYMINYFYPTRPRAFWLIFFKKDESRRCVIVSPEVTSLRKKRE